jgi:hypothetical protein
VAALTYDYTAAKAKAASMGLGWSDEVAAQVDPQFVALTLDQGQVDHLLYLHMYYLLWAMNPKRLTFWQRVQAVAFILRGRR